MSVIKGGVFACRVVRLPRRPMSFSAKNSKNPASVRVFRLFVPRPDPSPQPAFHGNPLCISRNIHMYVQSFFSDLDGAVPFFAVAYNEPLVAGLCFSGSDIPVQHNDRLNGYCTVFPGDAQKCVKWAALSG